MSHPPRAAAAPATKQQQLEKVRTRDGDAATALLSSSSLAMTTRQFEEILTRASGHGRWQWLLFIIGSLSGFFNAFHHLGRVFLGGSPDHWCSVAVGERVLVAAAAAGAHNLTADEWKSYSVPRDPATGAFSSCQVYDRDYDAPASFLAWRSSNGSEDPAPEQRDCSSGWVYDRSQYESTIVTEWDLVCSRKPLLPLVQATYMGGVFCGCFIYGIISDRYGRRFGAMISLTLFLVSGVATAFSVHYAMFVALRFVIATSAAGLFTCTFVLVTEVTIPRFRTLFGIFFQIPFAVGYMALPGLAYLLRDWKYLQLAMALPNLVLISYVWLLSESPRWLITHGHFDRALHVLKKAAKINRHPFPSEGEVLQWFKEFKEHEDLSKQSQKFHKFGIGFVQDLFCRRQMLKRIVIMYFTWFAVAMVYYGLVLNVDNLGSDPYFLSFLNAAVEVPAYVLVYFLLERGGRRKGYCGTFLAGGIACLVIVGIPKRISWAVVTLAVLGKFCVTATFAIAYLFTAELFPTSVRNIAVNSSSMCGRIGSVLAPFVVDILGNLNRIVPLIIFGVVSVTAGVLALFLPETNKKNMVEDWGTGPIEIAPDLTRDASYEMKPGSLDDRSMPEERFTTISSIATDSTHDSSCD